MIAESEREVRRVIMLKIVPGETKGRGLIHDFIITNQTRITDNSPYSNCTSASYVCNNIRPRE